METRVQNCLCRSAPCSRPPYGPNISSISCFFLELFAKIIGWHPFLGGWRKLLWGILDSPLATPACLPACLLPVCLSFHLSVYLSVSLSSLFICLFFFLSVRLFVLLTFEGSTRSFQGQAFWQNWREQEQEILIFSAKLQKNYSSGVQVYFQIRKFHSGLKFYVLALHINFVLPFFRNFECMVYVPSYDECWISSTLSLIALPYISWNMLTVWILLSSAQGKRLKVVHLLTPVLLLTPLKIKMKLKTAKNIKGKYHFSPHFCYFS